MAMTSAMIRLLIINVRTGVADTRNPEPLLKACQ